jgi:phytoene desaturase
MTALSETEVVVVGAGFGGLSAACYLADAGADVRVLERNDQLGGRASTLERDGFRFDMGPSWYLMPDVFERFFGHFGRTPGEYYDLTHLDPHYRIFFKDGDRAEMRGDRAHVRTLFESYEEGAGDAVEAYLETSRRHYRTAMDHFVYEHRPTFADYVDTDVLRAAPVGLGLLGSMQSHVEDYFDHPKLQQIVQYTLVFLGGSPTNTPALYNIMSHVDVDLGVHYPEGGMAGVVDAVVALARECGVTFETGTEVAEIRRAPGGLRVETAAGAVHRPDAVVSNADYAHTELDLLSPDARQQDPDYWAERTYAPSAFLLYLGVEGDVDPLAHHTLVLPEEWEAHFTQIFDAPAWPDDPAYYCCVPSQTDDSVAPAGHSNLFVLVPIAPGLEDGPETRAAYRDQVLADLASSTGVDVRDRIVLEEQFSVSDFARRYNSTRGTALGLAHTLRQTGPLRPSIRSSALEGLYFVGGNTTPGIGVPMCLISGQHAADALIEDRGGPVPPRPTPER